MAEAEEVQELGREGVGKIKRWLEATTFMELNWNVYEDPAMCTLPCLNDQRKKFDLVGSFIGINRNPIAIECKRYTSAGAQHKYFKEFLATAYSNILHDRRVINSDPKREFFWVTTHPFQIKEWTTLATEEKVYEAISENPKLVNTADIDQKLVRSVADRIWILVMHEKQESISLTHDELMEVLTRLKRKAPTL